MGADIGELPSVGDLFGRYRLERRLGHGGMGVVYLATDTELNRPVAVKLMLGGMATDPEFLERFRREAVALARSGSPNVLEVYDYGELDGVPFIVTRYVAGGALDAAIGTWGPLPVAHALDVCAQVADALAASHRAGVIHRDVKSANVLLDDPTSGHLHAYLSDFGIARTMEPGLTVTGAVPGTLTYQAPELADGGAASVRTDIYAVGCLLFECLTGAPPYVGTDVQVMFAHASAPIPQFRGEDRLVQWLNAILRATLAKDPAHRYPSCEALAEHLRGAAAEQVGDFDPRAVERAGAPVLTPRRRRHWPLVAGVVGLVLALAIGSTVWAIARGGSGGGGPVVVHRVTGDLDGDGRGDVAAEVSPSELGGFDRVEWRSTGHSLRQVSRTPASGADALLGDFDGDGRLDEADVDSYISGPRAKITIRYGDGRSGTDGLDLPPVPKNDFAEATFVGDFNGDGKDDIGFATQPKDAQQQAPLDLHTGLTADKRCGLWVSTIDDGRFGDVTDWGDGLPCFVPRFAVGDVNHDGKDDLVWEIEDGTNWQDTVARQPRLVPLTSDGDGFRAGTPLTVPGSEPIPGMMIVTGDVDGDGSLDVVTTSSGRGPTSSMDFNVWPTSASGIGNPRRWLETNALDAGFSSPEMTVSDVNGDGRDDLVVALVLGDTDYLDNTRARLGKDGVLDVLVSSTDRTFRKPAEWALCRRCVSDLALYRSATGSATSG